MASSVLTVYPPLASQDPPSSSGWMHHIRPPTAFLAALSIHHSPTARCNRYSHHALPVTCTARFSSSSSSSSSSTSPPPPADSKDARDNNPSPLAVPCTRRSVLLSTITVAAAAMLHPQPQPVHAIAPAAATAPGEDTPRSRPSVVSGSANTVQTSTTPSPSPSLNSTVTPSPAEQQPALTRTQTSSRVVAWGYLPENGPDRWATLSDDFAACENFGTQSPVALSYRESVVIDDDNNIENESSASRRPTLALLPGRFHVRLREAQPGAQFKSFMFDVYMPRPPPLVGDAPPVDSYRPPANPATLTLADGTDYILNGFHLHAPFSEHSIDGNRGVLELHFVFQQRRWIIPPSVARANAGPLGQQAASATTADFSSGNTDIPLQAQAPPRGDVRMAVLAVIFDEAEHSSPWLRTILDVAIPGDATAGSLPEAGKLVDLDLSGILPTLDATDVYEYTGSLTTPPGTEGIRWVVLGKRAYASAADVAKLRDAQNGPNVRPLQPLGSRRVLRYPAKSSPRSAPQYAA